MRPDARGCALAAALLAAALSAGCNSEPDAATPPEGSQPAPGCGVVDLAGGRATRALDAQALDVDGPRYVEVEVSEIQNPDSAPIYFEVHHEGPGGGAELLGSFAPFPSHQPGTYLVAAGGALREGGELVVTMRSIRPPRDAAPIRATVARIDVRSD